ncbi:MAG TPA: hypothetical protein VNY32_06180, partial [Candidatus Acidoferrales bacterium]|nr:hypothetical protein [Candidatus Acidoferrales bacterium]
MGLVKSCPGGEFPVGAKVAALMGGLGGTTKPRSGHPFSATCNRMHEFAPIKERNARLILSKNSLVSKTPGAY